MIDRLRRALTRSNEESTPSGESVQTDGGPSVSKSSTVTELLHKVRTSNFFQSLPFWLPAGVLMAVFVYGTIGWNALISLTDWSGLGDPSMNFFDVERHGTRVVGDRFEYLLSDTLLTTLGDATDLVVGVRPEDIELVDGVETDHDFETIIDVVEPTGNENHVYLTFEETATEPQTFIVTVSGM